MIDYSKLIEALRCGGTSCRDECPYSNGREWCDEDRIIKDAADALETAEKRIEELEAQMPKEGKWTTKRTWEHDGEIYCSVCNHDAPTEGDYRQVKTNYCPNCGAKMKNVTDCHDLNER